MGAPSPGDVTDEGLERLLVFLRDHRGFDFTGYKRASLSRRINKRMATVGAETYEAYQDYLEVHPHEFTQLFDTILIKVTRFFRDAEYWEHLATEVIPAILDQKPAGEPIRAWCAGCASGEEAYTLAILLTEALGVEAFRDRVKLYATELDESALATARAGRYRAEEVEQSVPGHLVDTYFTREGTSYTFRHDLRRSIIFGRHDLVSDAPISRLDLLVCRNVLMYFNAEAQGRILANLHFALDDDGVLFLGKAEMLLAHHEDFQAVSMPYRVFRRAPGSGRPRAWLGARRATPPPPPDEVDGGTWDRAAFEVSPWAQVVLDDEDRLVRANERARSEFGLGSADLGRPFRDLQLSYQPLELRSRVTDVRQSGSALRVSDVLRVRDATTEHLDVRLLPLADAGGRGTGIGIVFEDVTRYVDLTTELQRSREELGAANAELQATYEELQSTNEELETTNEELQSTVEELETTNEELQSSNEELETMNEELQSTNAEQAAVNAQLADHSRELDRLNLFLRSVLSSVSIGIVVLDEQHAVQAWNDHATELWGLRADEVLEQTFFELDIGLPVGDLRAAVKACQADGRRVELDAQPAVNRRGRHITCRVTVTPLQDRDDVVRGAIVLMEDQTRTPDLPAR